VISKLLTASYHSRRQRPCGLGEKPFSMYPAAPSPLISVPEEEKTMAAWISGDWEHGACLGSLQASQEQRHVENNALVLGVSGEEE
jgi:hypothetical protein